MFGIFWDTSVYHISYPFILYFVRFLAYLEFVDLCSARNKLMMTSICTRQSRNAGSETATCESFQSKPNHAFSSPFCCSRILIDAYLYVLLYCYCCFFLLSFLYIVSTWNPKQPFFIGCFNWMIPILYIGNGCFTKHPF